MRGTRRALLVSLYLSAGLALAGCTDDEGVVSAPDAGQSDAGGGGTVARSDAMPDFGNQDGLPEGSCAKPQAGSLSLWACAQREGVSTVGAALMFEGVVEELVEGPWDCLGGWASGDVPGSRRFRVADGSEEHWVGWTLPMHLIEVGDAVTVEYSSYLGQHSTSGRLVVTRSGGPLVGWLGKVGLDALEPPQGISVERAGDPCSYDAECGTVELDGLQVEVLSERAHVPYGASVEVGDYVVQGSDSQLTASRCQEVRGAGTTIAV